MSMSHPLSEGPQREEAVSENPRGAGELSSEVKQGAANGYRKPNTSWNCSSRSLSFVAGVLFAFGAMLAGLALLKWGMGVRLWR